MRRGGSGGKSSFAWRVGERSNGGDGETVAEGRRRCVSRLTWSRYGGSATTEVALRAVRELPVRKLFLASPPTAPTFLLGPGHRASIEPARLFIYSHRVDKLIVCGYKNKNKIEEHKCRQVRLQFRQQEWDAVAYLKLQ